MSERDELERILTDVAREHGAELRVDERRRTVGAVHARRSDGTFTYGLCPRCRGDQFAYELGDMDAVCDGCGAVVDVDDLIPAE